VTRSTREIGLLRGLSRNLALRPWPAATITEEYLRAEGLAVVRRRGDSLVAVLKPGHTAFTELSESIVAQAPDIERGAIFANFQTELLEFLASSYLGRDAASIGDADVLTLKSHLSAWFAKRATPRKVFVPCVISPWAAPRFAIGPVVFVFIDDVIKSEFYPSGDSSDVLSRHGFDGMLKLMRDTHANWLTCVSVEGCEQRRAEEIGNVAVDLAIVALQLAAPALDTRAMARLDSRRGAREKRTISEADGYCNEGWSRNEPGLVIGTGTLADILQKTKPLITAVGSCVGSFASGRFRLPKLEQAWCDAAYWLHEALAEPLDSIAVAKLETALEVLLRAESTSGSEARMLAVLETFYALKPSDPITKGSTTTAKQFARSIVRDRSQILHGTSSTLNARLAVNRDVLENFALPVIRRTALELQRYAVVPSSRDDVDEFLAWVKRRESCESE
jgi:hypothetical protein